MLGRTHVAVSIFISILFFSFHSFDKITNTFLLFVFLIASLFPDIDSSTSILGRRVKLISKLFKHRGFFHSIWALVLFSTLFYVLFTPVVGYVFAAGFTLHLILDAISKEGIKLFGFKIKGPIKVGSFLEHIFYIFILVLSLFLLL